MLPKILTTVDSIPTPIPPFWGSAWLHSPNLVPFTRSDEQGPSVDFYACLVPATAYASTPHSQSHIYRLIFVFIYILLYYLYEYLLLKI